MGSFVVLIVSFTLVCFGAAVPMEFDEDMNEWGEFFERNGYSNNENFNGCGRRETDFGRDTWNFLHTLAANYPENPSPEQQMNMREMMRMFTNFYPRPNNYFRRSVMHEEADTRDRQSFSQWMCRIHNRVNQQKGKPMFNCQAVNALWMNDCYQSSNEECDPDRSMTGRATWDFMHTFAYTYPEDPSPEQQEDMARLMYLIAEFYPSPNYYYTTGAVFNDKPDTRDREHFMNWMCRVHNYVNLMKGKPEFDCNEVWEQWQYGGC